MLKVKLKCSKAVVEKLTLMFRKPAVIRCMITGRSEIAQRRESGKLYSAL